MFPAHRSAGNPARSNTATRDIHGNLIPVRANTGESIAAIPEVTGSANAGTEDARRNVGTSRISTGQPARERDKTIPSSKTGNAGRDLPARLLDAAGVLRDKLERLRFGPPVAYVYNPLVYAWKSHALYLERYGSSRKRVIFLGMNPGPFGMVQTGVPFGEVEAVRSWLEIGAEIGQPARAHPKRPIQGFACPRSEVSGRRLWALFADQFGNAAAFARDHLVLNYCPLAFMEESGRNRTPDKLAPEERAVLYELCDDHLRQAVAAWTRNG